MKWHKLPYGGQRAKTGSLTFTVEQSVVNDNWVLTKSESSFVAGYRSLSVIDVFSTMCEAKEAAEAHQ